MGKLAQQSSSCLIHRVWRAGEGRRRQGPEAVPEALRQLLASTGQREPRPLGGARNSILSAASTGPRLLPTQAPGLDCFSDREGSWTARGRSEPHDRARKAAQGAVHRAATRRQPLAGAATQRQAAVGAPVRNSGRPHGSTFWPCQRLLLIKDQNLPNCPKAWSWQERRVSPILVWAQR